MKYQTANFLWLSPAHCVLVAEKIDKLILVETNGTWKVFDGGAFQPIRDYYIDISTGEIRYFIHEDTGLAMNRKEYEELQSR